MFNIQFDSPSMLTPIVSINNEFIQILKFGIIKYRILTYTLRLLLKNLELFCSTIKECPVAIQTSN